jgi:hypothetical protein
LLIINYLKAYELPYDGPHLTNKILIYFIIDL